MKTTQQIIGRQIMKAYRVFTDRCEANVIVFAPDRNKAKSWAQGTEWFHASEWIDLRCIREPLVDKFSSGEEEVLDGSCERSQIVMRAAGFYQIDSSTQECEECGLYEWSRIKGSTVQERQDGNFRCGKCQEAQIAAGLETR